MGSSLRHLIESLQLDAVRVALTTKKMTRRPSAGGYGGGRHRPDSGGLSESEVSGNERCFGLFEELHRFRC